jgi:hypothetical protein
VFNPDRKDHHWGRQKTGATDDEGMAATASSGFPLNGFDVSTVVYRERYAILIVPYHQMNTY